MGIFKQNTESALMNKLASIKGNVQGYSAFILKSDLLNTDQKRELRSERSQELFLKLMQMGHIAPYFCRDNDIFFIFTDSRKYFLDEIKKLISHILPEYRPDDVILESFFDYYRLSESYDIVYQIAHQKEIFSVIEQRKQAGRILDEHGNEIRGFTWSNELFADALAERELRNAKMLLIVEDDEILRDLAVSILREEFRLKAAENACIALEYYNQHAPDVVFLDINMPGMNGIELLEKLIRHDAKARIVMFSSKTASDVVTKALKMGAVGYVVKPFTPASLLKYARKIAAS